MYLDLYIRTYTIGKYDRLNHSKVSNIQTCISTDLRPGFEGHDTLQVSWTAHSTHGISMYLSCNM